MPELPEVEVIHQFLAKKIIGQTISGLKILTPKSFIGNPKLIEGQKIIKLSRLGKQLSVVLKNNLVLLFHLKMTGQIIYSGTVLGHPLSSARSARLIFTLSNGRKLLFNDQRKFGWARVFTPAELIKFQKNLGLDVLDPLFTPKYFHSQLQSSSRPVKTVLLDQSKFAGIGNIYANDSLFLSKIHPESPANKISRVKALKLYHSLLAIMRQSILAGGSTAKDHGYLKPDGSSGSNQFYFRVYERKREPCLQCQTPIKYIKLGGRGTFFCPKCQKIVR
ncbi:MAG: bifunctional DNA-formamidopyrimidine glycosylase/DNA-(apurinic or apyrimidinic site) lyase [Candidatus Shapirobacteria bacterium]